MAFDRFFIAPFETGLQKNLKPFLIMDDAFETLNNAYVFRGRIRKRFGSKLMGALGQRSSRLRVQIGTTDAGGNFGPVGVPGNIYKIGQMFSVGNQLFTVYQAVGAMLATAGTGTGTFNTGTGIIQIATASPLTAVYYYPSEPVMGLTNYEIDTINNQPSYAFDTQFAYVWTGSGWDISPGSPTWNGNDLDFFWSTNWDGIVASDTVLFVTNFNATIGAPGPNDDPMYYFDGTNWNNFSSLTVFLTAGNFVQTARIILPFKDRLILLNTIEQDPAGPTNQSFKNRCRFSHNGSPLSATAWLEQNQTGATGGGYIDAATEEEIISAEFIKDRLIVYFEQSTWELVYTGNQIQPFVWQKINTELGSESTFSTVPFDKEILTVGDVGFHGCNGANVYRIDDKIPDEVFQIKNKNISMVRVAGIRDYYTELVYWCFPPAYVTDAIKYPNKVLVYNYKNQSWAINDDVVTTWGYFQQQDDLTWASSAPLKWFEFNASWTSGVTQQQFRQILAGNQQGFVFIVMPDISRNAPVMQITNISSAVGIQTLTVIDHTLTVGEYILIENAQGVTGLNDLIFQITATPTPNTIRIATDDFSGTYVGGGTITRVSQIEIQSKQWNPYDKKGQNVYLSKIEFAVMATSEGEVTVDYYPSASVLSMLKDAQAGALMCNGVLETHPYLPSLYPLEIYQERLWHPLYFQADGECIQINISLSDSQMKNPAIALSDFELEAMVLHTRPVSIRLQ